MWEKIKELYAALFLVATTLWLLVHLVLIEFYGIVRIAESNQWILCVEIGLSTAILILAIERLIKDIIK